MADDGFVFLGQPDVVAASIAAHEADTTNVHGIANTAVLETTTGAQAKADAAQAAAIAASQPLDADLTAIAALTPSNDDLPQRKAGAWTNRTPAQVKTDLALVKGDVGLGSVDNTSDASKPVSTATQTALDAKLTAASNLSDLANAGTARTNLGLAGAADLVTVGEFVPRRMFITSSVVALVASGTQQFFHFTADKTETINTLTAYTGTVAAAATPTLCRMGVYSVAANGDLALITAHANDTTLFAATTTAYPKTLTTPFSKVAGVRYALSILVVSGATMPNFHGWSTAGTAIINTIMGVDPALSQYLNAQTDLVASVTAAGLTGSHRSFVAMRMS